VLELGSTATVADVKAAIEARQGEGRRRRRRVPPPADPPLHVFAFPFSFEPPVLTASPAAPAPFLPQASPLRSSA
jgi:hypothetical protein